MLCCQKQKSLFRRYFNIDMEYWFFLWIIYLSIFLLSIYLFIYISILQTIVHLFQYIGVCETIAFMACGSRCRLFSGVQVSFISVLLG